MSILDKSSLVMIPSGYKEDKLYSVKPRNGDGDFTFTRASTGTRVNADGYIEEVPWNIVEHSEELDDSYWTDDNTLTITENDSNSPIGNTTANKLVVNSGSTNAYVYRFEPTIGEKTLSVYGKKGAKNWLMLACLGAAKRVFFDLDNGVIGTNVGSLGASMSDEGNGWYRCSITFTYTSGNSGVYFYVTDNDNTFTVTGNDSDELYLWGAMVNKGNTPKNYIKTTDRLDIPRLDYSGGSTTPTLLLEGQRTNLVTYSEDFSQSSWSKVGTSVVSGFASPDGLTNAYKLVEDTSNGAHYFSFVNISVTSGSYYTSSAFFKKGESNFIQLLFSSSSHAGSNHANFDLQNGVVGSVSDGVAKIESVGEYYRCSYTSQATSTTTTNVFIWKVQSATSSRAESYGGDGTSGVYVWGAMAETGSFATSYIPTSGTSVTRVKDFFEADSLSTIIGQTEGCIFIDFVYLDGERFYIYDAANTADGFLIYRGGTAYNLQVGNGGSYWAITNFITGLTIGTRYKLAINYKLNDYKVCVNGSQVATSTSIGVPTTNKISSWGLYGTTDFKNKINQFMMFDEKLTDAELTTLTTI